MHSLNKGTEKVEVQLKWDPSPLGAPDSDLDLIAATYLARDPGGEPAYLVYFDSRSPDGTITLNRDSKNGKGLGIDESMTLELHRLGADYGRVIVGVAIQQNGGRLVFADVLNPEFRVMEGYTELSGATSPRSRGPPRPPSRNSSAPGRVSGSSTRTSAASTPTPMTSP